MSLKQAAEMALEALAWGEVDDAKEALHQALSQPEWVGLTKEEFEQSVDGLEDLEDCWVQIEAKLREKNT